MTIFVRMGLKKREVEAMRFCRMLVFYIIFVFLIKECNMDIIIRKPTDREISAMKTKPVWTCDVSEFDWYYDSEETCLIIEGDVTGAPVQAT